VCPTPSRRDRGAVDTSIEMLFGAMALLMVMLAVFEATAYWHARNVFDEAASEGARIAAAYDGDCDTAVASARAIVERMASGWSSRVTVACVDGPVVSVTVSGRSPGVLAGGLGIATRVTESAPKER
jgi:hypothetical protein